MKLLDEIEGLVSDKVGVIKTIISIIKLETRLAGLSVFPLLLNLCMLLIVLMVMWSALMLLLGFFVLQFFDNTMLAIFSVFLLNLGFFLGLLKCLSFNLKKMSFEKTRKYIINKENNSNDEPKKRVSC